MTTGSRVFSTLYPMTVQVPWQPGIEYTDYTGSTRSVSWSGPDSPKEKRLSSPRGAANPAKAKYALRGRPNPYSKTVIETDYAFIVWRRSNGGSTKTGTSNEYGYTDTHCRFDESQEYKLIAKLRRKVYGSGFHPGIFAAEMPEALRMITSSATRLRLGLLSAAIGDWRGIIRNLGYPRDYRRIRRAFLSFRAGRMTLSQFWLELQYGWLPLLGDLENATAYLAEAISGGAAKHSRRVAATRSWAATEYGTPGGLAYWGRKVTTFQLRYVITDLEADSHFSFPSLASVASVAWEKLPYSFVFDWVAPISDYLAALRTAADIRGVVVRSLKRTTVWDQWTPRPDNDFPAWYNFSQYNERRTMMSFDRSVSSEINPPTPLGDLSSSSIFSSWTRAANAVALLQNLRFRPGDRTGILKLLGQR